MNNNAVLRARGIGKTVKSGDSDLVILRDIDLEITPGEAVAIIGASGSGKSTLLALLAGLDTPSAGSVEVEGTSLFDLDEDARAELRGRSVGFVFQSFQLLSSLTALENVMLPLELTGKEDPEAAAIEMLKRVGLGERLHHYRNIFRVASSSAWRKRARSSPGRSCCSPTSPPAASTPRPRRR
jgi:putative ABC transport system ATP-binding protein